MIWWKPTIVRPLVAASFEAHARLVESEVAEILQRTEQFSLMISSAFRSIEGDQFVAAADTNTNTSAEVVYDYYHYYNSRVVVDPARCLDGLSATAGDVEHCLFGGRFADNSTIQLQLLKFFGSVTHNFVSDITLVPDGGSFVQVARYQFHVNDATDTNTDTGTGTVGDVSVEYVVVVVIIACALTCVVGGRTYMRSWSAFTAVCVACLAGWVCTCVFFNLVLVTATSSSCIPRRSTLLERRAKLP